jgi:hypothetical protein
MELFALPISGRVEHSLMDVLSAPPADASSSSAVLKALADDSKIISPLRQKKDCTWPIALSHQRLRIGPRGRWQTLHEPYNHSRRERYTRGTRRNARLELLCYQEEGLVGAVGIEPTTFGLKGRFRHLAHGCSARIRGVYTKDTKPPGESS